MHRVNAASEVNGGGQECPLYKGEMGGHNSEPEEGDLC